MRQNVERDVGGRPGVGESFWSGALLGTLISLLLWVVIGLACVTVYGWLVGK